MQICEVFASLNCSKAKIWMERSEIVYLLLCSHLKDDEERSDEEENFHFQLILRSSVKIRGRAQLLTHVFKALLHKSSNSYLHQFDES